jgi:hypothetical protein
MLSLEALKRYLAQKESLRLLALDIDGCTYLGDSSPRSDGLNQALIDIASDYDVVFFVTHRAYWMYQLECARTEHNTWLTENVVANFINATGLPCLGVSSPDDEGTTPGRAFRCESSALDYQVTPFWSMPRHYLSKNPQLKQIIELVTNFNSSMELDVHYFDDRGYLLRLANGMTLPPNVALRCFQTTNENIQEIPASETSRCACALM